VIDRKLPWDDEAPEDEPGQERALAAGAAGHAPGPSIA
jgi:hypothetical protein